MRLHLRHVPFIFSLFCRTNDKMLTIVLACMHTRQKKKLVVNNFPIFRLKDFLKNDCISTVLQKKKKKNNRCCSLMISNIFSFFRQFVFLHSVNSNYYLMPLPISDKLRCEAKWEMRERESGACMIAVGFLPNSTFAQRWHCVACC